eukprot:CAMPEP_0113933644 /NCGR_PEP_ID=MMETSP1339-20121228/855_1 /TAXON_ID=94617 /ORGANISM="Fibrocapsa japonica" /LENGTH=664 /DNA_ID=CAMNT_0000935029 /DNA_START=61 /DNA_END=2055 /DNA_ORIENTATION=+ /assembly_acc=CAM_ASM_000762
MAAKNWVCDPDGFLQPKVGTSGPESLPPSTVFAVFKDTVAKHGDKSALKFKEVGPGAEAADVEFSIWTWSQYYAEVIKFAQALVALNFPPHACLNIIGFNCKEWFVAQFGAMAAGGIPAGIYPTNGPDACKYISEHSKAEVVVLEDNKQLDKYLQIGPRKLPKLKALVVYNEEPLEGAGDRLGIPVYGWSQFIDLGKGVPAETVEERIQAQLPGHCNSLIYTSGTTGPPKAVMLSHDNVTWTTNIVLNYANPDTFTCAERSISYLPLSHIAAQVLDMYLPMALGSTVHFAQPDALKGSLGKTLQEVKPTYFFGVPRVWEKIYEKMMAIGKTTTGLKKSIATWAKGKGLQKAQMNQFGEAGGAPCGYACANAVVFSKIKAALGLQDCKAFAVGAAPMSLEIFNYFASLDIPIWEVFGQSESTGNHTMNSSGLGWQLGSTGRPLPGTESMIVPETGELCFRGRHVFMGYMGMPQKTAETIDELGWLHTGDVAAFDDNHQDGMPKPSGFMKITGRIKELIITAGGENIPPVLIEDQFKKHMAAISNCMVIGDKRKFLAICICLKVEIDMESGIPTNKLTGAALDVCKEIGSSAATTEEAAADPKWADYLNAGMAKANADATSRAQEVKKWVILPTDFSEKGSELTPTLKLKRSVATEKYSNLIESMY